MSLRTALLLAVPGAVYLIWYLTTLPGETVLWIVALSAPVFTLLTALLNTLTFPKLKQEHPAETPTVSVLIPARNEADCIAETVRRLLAQNYPAFEVFVLDDNSDDGTADIALRAAGGDPRLTVIQGQPLPEEWMGKSWACRQLAATTARKLVDAAANDILLFTDADVRWEPDALSAVVARMERHRADMLTLWPTQETHTPAERLVVPLMAFVILGYLPEVCVRFIPWDIFAAANGQCLAFRREMYERIGGHERVRSNIVEDMGLAKLVKRHGGRLVMADGNGLVGCRMYSGWQEVRDGFAKNLLAGHGGKPILLILSALFHWAFFLIPWFWMGYEAFTGWTWLPFIMALCGVMTRAVSAAFTHQRVRDAFLLPVSVTLMSIIAWRSLRWDFTAGGPEWKGRRVTHVRTEHS